MLALRFTPAVLMLRPPMRLPRGLAAAFVLLVVATALPAADRITTPIDNNRRVVLKGHTRPEVQPANDQGLAGADMAVSYATLLLKLDPSIDAFLDQQQTPGSASYRRWLSPVEFGDRFGLTANDMSKVVAWLESQGLKVNDVARGRNWITFSGTAGSIGGALHADIHIYLVNGERHFANANDPSIPEALQDVVGGFRGLNDFRPQSMLRMAPVQPIDTPPHAGAPGYNNSAGNHFLAPDDLATIFNIAPLYNAGIDGTGQTLVIAGETDVNMSDLAAFQARFNLPPNLPQLMLFGPDPGVTGSLTEADLDLEWSTAVARNATIVYAYATNVFTAAQYAVDQNLGQMMSISYGGCEAYESIAYRGVAQQANAQGMTIFVSSGDSGAATCDRGGPVPLATHGATASWPASFPEITAVGGTEFNDGGGTYWATKNNANDASALSYIPETAWNDSVAANALEAGGGAPSVQFSKPVWQTGLGVPNDGVRDLPDISLTASPFKYAYLIQSQGFLQAVGGTSASSPSWAGIAALLNQYLMSNKVIAQPGLGNINPVLYRLAQATTDVFHDISSGSNQVPCLQSSPDCIDGMVGFSAGPGYDLATGLGSVDAFHLITEWNIGTATTTSLTAAPTSAGLGDSVVLTAKVTGGSGASPTGAIDFVTNDVNLGTAALAPSGPGTATATLTVTGSQIAIGDGTVAALYSGDGVYTGSEGRAAVTITIPATTGSFVVPWVTPNPVPEQGADSWPYTVGLTEKNGVATTVTGFTINGVNNLSGLPTTNLPANGTIRANFAGSGLTVPLNRVFLFTGQDGSGALWTQSITVPFIGPAGEAASLNPAIRLTTTTPAVFENPQAGPSCQWVQQLTVQETGGYYMVLTKLTVNSASFTPQLPVIFGTTRLAPYGILQGTLCLPATTGPGPATYILTGSLSDGQLSGTLSAVMISNLEIGPSGPSISVSPESVTLSVTGASPSASATVSVTSVGTWSAAVLPSNRATAWLTLPQASGSGPVTLQASGAGLSPGVYNATVAFTSNPPTSNQIPVTIPVTLLVNPSSVTKIAGLVNNFSGSTAVAPGEMVAVFGTAMAPHGVASTAPFLPLPLDLNGVSATVNGVSAPLYYVSPTQVDLQIPYETGAGPAVLGVNNNGQIAAFPIQVAATAPGLFPFAIDAVLGTLTTVVQQSQILVLYITGEGDVTPTLATGATPPPNSNPAKYPAPRQPLGVTIGGVTAPIGFAGVPNGVAGVTQIDMTVPATAPLGQQALVVTVGGVQSQAVMLTVNPAAGSSVNSVNPAGASVKPGQ
jgi:uncharacterized protein (TIGR03437 family)